MHGPMFGVLDARLSQFVWPVLLSGLLAPIHEVVLGPVISFHDKAWRFHLAHYLLQVFVTLHPIGLLPASTLHFPQVLFPPFLV